MRLGDLITLAKVERCGDRDFPVLSMTMHDGIVLQADRFKKAIASKDKSTYKVVKPGQLVVGFPIDEGVLYVQGYDHEGIMSPAYNVWNVDTKLVDVRYLELALHSPQSMSFYKEKMRGTTARRRSLPAATLIELDIPVPTRSEQVKVVNTLLGIRASIANSKSLERYFDELVKSRFVEMFGELSGSNCEGDTEQLSNLAEIVSGITKGRKVSAGMPLREVPYMAVSNVKDGYIDWTKVKTIEATDAEIERYRLEPYDVLMTEGGDPDKLGRGALLMEPPEDCIHQNHVFRVRIKDDRLKPEYFEYYLQSPKAKDYFLSCAKRTTGIATINKKQISSLPVIIPGIERQQAFMAFVQQVDKLKFACPSGK